MSVKIALKKQNDNKKNFWLPIISLLVLFLISFTIVIVFHGQPKTDIISWFEADDRLYVISKSRIDANMRLDTGEEYGNYIKIYSDYKILNGEPAIDSEPDFQSDLSELKPFKIQVGDIDGDGVKEIAVCVYKTAKFHPVPAKRPFFYRLNEGELEDVWLGSRLARPFDDFILFDIDQDDIDEIISIEVLENGNKVIAIYDWKGFGFEVKTVSDELEEAVVFLNNLSNRDTNILVEIAKNQYQVVLEEDQIKFVK